MFDDAAVVTTEGLAALVSALSGGGDGAGSGSGSDAERVEQLAVLDRVKAAAAAAQARVTAAFVASQEQVAQAWLDRARECSAAGDFDGWRAAREQARAASLDEDLTRSAATGDSPPGGGDASGGSRGRRGRASRLAGVAGPGAPARRQAPVQRGGPR